MGNTVIDSRGDGNGMLQALQVWMQREEQRKARQAELDQQNAQFQQSYGLDKQRTAAQVGQATAATDQSRYAVSSDRAKTIADSIKTRFTQLMDAGQVDAARNYAQAATQQFAQDKEVQAAITGMVSPSPVTGFDTAKANSAQWAADSTGRAANGGQGAIDVNLTQKLATGEQLSGPAFGNQQQREFGLPALERTVAIAGGRAPSADVTAQIAGQERMNNADNATTLRAAALNRQPVSSPLGNVGGGEELLKQLPPDTAELVKKIANYEMDLTKVTSMRGEKRQQLAQLVAAYDPTFDMSQYGSRAKLRQDFTSGTGSRNIRSLNTAVKHLETLAKVGAELDNSSFTPYNAVANTLVSGAGDPRKTKFNMAANAVESELASLFKGTGATDQEIKAWRENLSSSASPEQMKQAVHMATELLSGRLSAVAAQWESGMGKPADFDILSPDSRATLQRMGLSVDGAAPSGGGSGGGGVLRAKNPQTGQRIESTDGGATWHPAQ